MLSPIRSDFVESDFSFNSRSDDVEQPNAYNSSQTVDLTLELQFHESGIFENYGNGNARRVKCQACN